MGVVGVGVAKVGVVTFVTSLFYSFTGNDGQIIKHDFHT